MELAGFTNWFGDQCTLAGLRNCSAHGLRKAAARRLAEAGCTEHEIAAITGHASLREVQRYTKAADQKRLAAAAMQKVRPRTEENTELSNRPQGLTKRANTRVSNQGPESKVLVPAGSKPGIIPGYGVRITSSIRPAALAGRKTSLKL